MKKIAYSTTIIIFLFVLVAGCKKQKYYPTDSTTGEGTFGATINNKQLLPCVPFLTNGGPIKTSTKQYSPALITINVIAENSCDNHYVYGRYMFISFDSLQIIENTTYKFGRGMDVSGGVVRCMYSEDLSEYISDSTLPGTITVRKFDPILRILSTSFEATLKEKNTGQLVTLTRGKFDIKY